MRIGFFSDSYFPEIDGVTYTLKLWRERLEERGHEVFIIYPDSEDHQPGENEIPVRSAPNPFYEGYNVPLPLGYRSVPDNLDIVHCHTPFSLGRLGSRYADKNDLPKIYTHHTPVEEYFEQNTRSKLLADAIAKLYIPLENRFLSGFNAVSTSTGDINRKVDAFRLPVGIDLDFFRPQKESFVDELNLERPIAGYSGRISIEKNVEELCRFAEEFSGSLLIIGEGPKRDEVEEKAPSNVKIMDFIERDKLPEFYSGIDVFVTASTGDTLGLSSLEANACGTPVAAADVKPFSKTIGEENGGRFEVRNLEDMKETVNQVLEGEFTTREAVRDYDVEKTIDKLQDKYTELKD